MGGYGAAERRAAEGPKEAAWGGRVSFLVSPPQACENGRGAILLSVARGKVSEGIDFGEWPRPPVPRHLHGALGVPAPPGGHPPTGWACPGAPFPCPWALGAHPLSSH